MRYLHRSALSASILATVCATSARAQLNPGDLVISTVSNSTSLPYANALDTAAPIVLQQFSLANQGTTATADGSMTLAQTNNGANSAISGEYGSASEGLLQQSANGQYLTIMGYGVNANTFNSAASTTYGTAALGQTTSLTAGNQTGTPVATVARVVALIGANGTVDTSTALTGVFNQNNPRSVATIDGTSFYVSGQGAKGDTTNGVFYASRGSTTATAIDTSTDTRSVQLYNGTLYVSRDYNPPGGAAQNFTNVSSLTSATGGLPTTSAGLITTHITPPADAFSSKGNNGSINLTAALENGVNNSRVGSFVYLSPEQYVFASPNVLYVADSGAPKNGSAGAAALGEGGLQKWVLTNGTWTLDYDLVAGLNLVNNATANANTPSAPGVTGLFGLTVKVVGNQAELFATSYGLNELSQSYLYEITDTLSDTTIAQAASESFTTLDTAALGTSIRGVAFAPTDVSAVPVPGSAWLLVSGIAGLGWVRRKRQST